MGNTNGIAGPKVNDTSTAFTMAEYFQCSEKSGP